ncbi:hypothetical protein G3H79_20075 [Streptomyces aureoverticillatus]|nr:hypothetical protein G3H79_20075 [Streptomyces aureoverticillatus]
MGIDHGVANLERHVTGTPSVAIQGNTDTASSEWRFRRSGHISGLDNSNRNVLREGCGRGYSQVGATVRRGRNAHVTDPARAPQGDERPGLPGSRR